MTISGTTTLIITTTGTTLMRAAQLAAIAPVDTAGSTLAPGAIFATPKDAPGIPVSDNGYLYNYSLSGGWQPAGFVPFVGMEAGALLLGQAAMDSVNNRLLALRDMTREPRMRLWANWLARRDTIDARFYNNSNATTQGVQIGADWANANSNADESLAFGLSYDYAKTDMSIASTSANATASANGIGAYLLYKSKWYYADAAYHRNFAKYETRTPDYGNVNASGRGWATTLELGLTPSRPTWPVKAEPFVQWTYQTNAISRATDTAQRIFTTDDIKSNIYRAGLRLMQEYKLDDDVFIRPYLRASWATEQDAKLRVLVTNLANAADLAAKGQKVAGVPITNDLGGSGYILDAGVTIQASRHFSLYASLARNKIGSITGYNGTFGANCTW